MKGVLKVYNGSDKILEKEFDLPSQLPEMIKLAIEQNPMHKVITSPLRYNYLIEDAISLCHEDEDRSIKIDELGRWRNSHHIAKVNESGDLVIIGDNGCSAELVKLVTEDRIAKENQSN